MSPRALFLSLLAAGLVLAGLALHNGGILQLAIPFIAYLLVGLWLAPPSAHVRVVRSADRAAVLAGEHFRVNVDLVNEGPVQRRLSIADSVPSTARVVDGEPRSAAYIERGGSVQLQYALSSRRGICSWSDVRITVTDPLGLFGQSLAVPAPGEVVVRPEPVRLARISFRPRDTLRTPGPVPVPLAGPGTDFLGIREYQAGDSLRHINWRLAARHPGRLFTNEHERHEVGDYCLVLDSRMRDAEVFERSVGVAASLAESLLREGNRLAMLVFGRVMSTAFPGYGNRQLNLILRNLAGAQQSPGIPLTYLEYFPRRLFARRSVLIIISAISPDDESAYAALRARGHDIVLVSPNTLDRSAKGIGGRKGAGMALRLARVERRWMLLSLRKLGIQVVDLNLDQPLERALEPLTSASMRRGAAAERKYAGR